MEIRYSGANLNTLNAILSSGVAPTKEQADFLLKVMTGK